MFNLQNKTDAHLAFIRDDAAAALAAMPTGHKAEHYLAEFRAVCREAERRDRIRSYRRTLAATLFDRLAIRQRRTAETGAFYRLWRHPITDYDRNQARNAAFSLAWIKRHG